MTQPLSPADAPLRRHYSATDTYFLDAWGGGYFCVNAAGHMAVRPLGPDGLEVDLHAVVRELQGHGVQFPLLVRFQDLLRTRVRELNAAFRDAIDQSEYPNVYRGVFPVKVNQLREVVEEIVEAGAPDGFGLECGSKSELIATLPYVEDDTLLICNGVKDRLMMRLMLEGQALGRNIIPVLERREEYESLLDLLPEFDLSPQFGVRVRLSTSGAGLWSESGGENSKFGFSLTELIELIEDLTSRGAPATFRLLHFHLGSQIAHLNNVRQAVQEGARIYAELRRRGMPVAYLDVGGGLGVSYEAGNPAMQGHIDYTLREYASAVVGELKRVCDQERVPAPILVSESGRAITALHSVLIVEVLDARSKAPEETSALEESPPLVRAFDALRAEVDEMGDRMSPEALTDIYRRAKELQKKARDEFRAGSISLEEKAAADQRFWLLCAGARTASRKAFLDESHPTGRELEALLADHYLCNFSVFRSLADYWALGQRFPILPIHRLNEAPTRDGILVDLTCDSDGRVSEFVSSVGDKRTLELHELRPDESYFLGCFLMGAYQDIMGDMHNLFGRVTEAHVYADADEPENFYVEKILDGATVEEQLALVQYAASDLERRMNDRVLDLVREADLKPREGALFLEQYRRAFQEYTYVSRDPGAGKKAPVRGKRIRRRQ